MLQMAGPHLNSPNYHHDQHTSVSHFVITVEVIHQVQTFSYYNISSLYNKLTWD
jgi:hypothetical protein